MPNKIKYNVQYVQKVIILCYSILDYITNNWCETMIYIPAISLINFDIFQPLGVIFIIIVIVLLILLATTGILGYVLLKKNKLIFPKLFLYIMDNYFSILLKFFLIIGTEETFYKIGIELYNKYYAEDYKKASNKVMVLPHCLRDLKCPAKLGKDGIGCVFCKKCPLGDIIKAAEEKNIDVYIVPGSTFLKRILKEKKPDAVFGVACYSDLFHVMNYLSRKGIPTQGQLLLTDGCVCTTVDVKELLNNINETENNE